MFHVKPSHTCYTSPLSSTNSSAKTYIINTSYEQVCNEKHAFHLLVTAGSPSGFFLCLSVPVCLSLSLCLYMSSFFLFRFYHLASVLANFFVSTRLG